MTTNTQHPDKYELCVERIASDGLLPTYEALIYRSVWAGICGPFSETVTLEGMGAVIEWADREGYVTTGWPEVGSNGTATYPLARKS